jgi:hypothetical protein
MCVLARPLAWAIDFRAVGALEMSKLQRAPAGAQRFLLEIPVVPRSTTGYHA